MVRHNRRQLKADCVVVSNEGIVHVLFRYDELVVLDGVLVYPNCPKRDIRNIPSTLAIASP